MSLRKKVLLIITLGTIFFVLVGGGLSYSAFLRNSKNLEILDIKTDAGHLHHALDRELDNLSALTNDWSVWDDTYQFILDQNQEYKDSNLVDGTFNNLGLNLMVYFNVHGDIIYQRAYDLTSQKEISIPNEFIAFIQKNPEIISSSYKEIVSGFLTFDDTPVIFSINPILTSLDEGPSHGSLLFAKFIQGNLLDQIKSSVDSTLSIIPYDQFDVPKEGESFSFDEAENNVIVVRNNIDQMIYYYSTIEDVNKNPIYIIKQVKERTIYQQGLSNTRNLLFLILLSGIFTGGIVIYTLEKSFISRLFTLNNTVKRYRKERELKDIIRLSGDDELSSLSGEIDQTFHSLAETQKDLGDHLAFEKMMVEISTKFINLPTNKIDQGIQEALETFGIFLGGDRCRILIFHNQESSVLNQTHEWCKEGVPSINNAFQNLDIKDFKWLFEKMNRGENFVVSNIDDLPKKAKPERDFLINHEISSVIAAPLIVNGLPIGALTLEIISRDKEWDAQTPIMVEIIGNTIANAIDRRKNERELQLSQQFQFRLNQITKTSIEKESFYSSIRTLSRKLTSLINSDKGFLVLSDRYFPFQIYDSGRLMKMDKTITNGINYLLKKTSKKVFIKNNQNVDENYPVDLDFIGTSFITIPLIVKKQQLGLVILANEKSHTYSQLEIAICQQAAPLITLAIMKIRALEGAQRTSKELKSLRATIADITSELELTKLLHKILERAIKLLRADGGVFYVYHADAQELEVVVSFNLDKDYKGIRIKSNEGAAGKAIHLRKTITIKDYSAQSYKLEEFKNANIRSAMVSPLMIGERILGSIGIVHFNPNAHFSDNDQHLLNIFSQHASIAMDNAMLFEKVQEMARIDEVTGLLNRRALNEIGAYEVARAIRLNRPIAVAMVDLDNYKRINDTCSHLTGDKVLKEVARLIRENVRNIDIIGRFGGDEMVIIMPETDQLNAVNAAERIRAVLEASVIKIDKYEFKITASFGISVFQENPPPLDELIEQTDKAMYAAKDAGRNCIRVFQEIS